MTLKSIFLALIILPAVVSCSSDPLDVDVSDVSIDIKFIDMDSAFVNSSPSQLLEMCKKYKTDIKDIYEYQIGHCWPIGNIPTKDIDDSIKAYLSHPYMVRLENRIKETFGDKAEMQNKIVDGFKHLKFHFPEKDMPESVVFINSGFAGSAISMEKDIAVGLERYLGNNVDVIQELPPDEFYAWIKEAMDRQFLERDVMASWIMTNIIEEPKSGSLVENIVYWGKIIYLVEACYPEDSENTIIRYSQEDYDWSIENELAYWEYLVKQELLFKLDDRTKMNMLREGPFTPGLPEVGPDRLGQYLGWRMVRQYMENHSDLSLKELINKNYNSILQEYETEE